METWTIVGYLGAFSGAVSLIPEVMKASKTHHLQDISWGMLFLQLSSSFFWGIYGIHINDMPLIISGAINFTLSFALIMMKKNYELTGKPLLHIFRKTVAETEIAEDVDKNPA